MAALAFLKEQLLQPIRVPFMSLPLQVVLKILEISKLKEGDVIYDLGCGDGRILVEASKRYKTKGVGIDIDKKAVEMALSNVDAEKLNDKIKIHEGDFTDFDVSNADVVLFWLTEFASLRLRPHLVKHMKFGSKIVTIDRLGCWTPSEIHEFSYTMEFDNRIANHTIYVFYMDLDEDARKRLSEVSEEEFGLVEPPIAPPPPM